MQYTQISVEKNVIRSQILEYLKQNRHRLILNSPTLQTGADRQWAAQTQAQGIEVSILVDEVFNLLLSSGQAITNIVSVNDSTVMHANEAYEPLRIKQMILEEVLELSRYGILIQAHYKPIRPNQSFDFLIEPTVSSVLLSEFGDKYLAQDIVVPYFIEQYLNRLDRLSPLSDELKSYLTEGLSCLHSHHSRAAALLLRLAAEFVLSSLIESTQNFLTDHEKQTFIGKIRGAGIRIEERAEVLFQKLDASAALLPSGGNVREDVKNRLRAAFHSIRDLGGRAAHLSNPVLVEEVQDHFTLFASSVYPIAIKIIEFQAIDKFKE